VAWNRRWLQLPIQIYSPGDIMMPENPVAGFAVQDTTDPFQLTLEDLEQRLDENPDWDADCLKRVASLPTQFQYEDYYIRCNGERRWIQARHIPMVNGDRFELLDSTTGLINMGWGAEWAVNATGLFIHKNERRQAVGNFLVSDQANAFCFLAANSSTPLATWFRETRYGWGCSVSYPGYSWEWKLGTLPFQYAFNDTDNNQSGFFSIIVRRYRTRAFYEKLRVALKCR